jgi:hypothetical protein
VKTKQFALKLVTDSSGKETFKFEFVQWVNDPANMTEQEMEKFNTIVYVNIDTDNWYMPFSFFTKDLYAIGQSALDNLNNSPIHPN